MTWTQERNACTFNSLERRSQKRMLKGLQFDRGYTFLAKSVFFGPNACNEVEIEPVSGYCPSNWTNKVMCHAMLAYNAGSELTTITNIEEHVQATCPPVVPHLLQRYPAAVRGRHRPASLSSAGRFRPSTLCNPATSNDSVSGEWLRGRADHYVHKFSLNVDQASALIKMADMLSPDSDTSICLVHGVFGAGKSYLLAVVVLYLVDVFQVLNRGSGGPAGAPQESWKLLVSSTTNVAVDRILQWLLELGFSDFVRVGSVKKIAKNILPYSVHAFGSESQELKELQDLDKTELTIQERSFIRRSIEQQKLGLNRRKLCSVLVVGATCAACPFACMDKNKFPIVLLDECSQITEPSSLLPIARFQARKLLLVGDPQQLGPTLHGCASDSTSGDPSGVHSSGPSGLEQTLFHRLLKMEHESVLLRTQYRCHPRISSLANQLFYDGRLLDGVLANERPPLMQDLPSVCFLDTRGREVADYDGSFYNVMEVDYCLRLITLLLNHAQTASIGVITLYRAQAARLTTALREAGVCSGRVGAVQVSTVDAFQGAERDVIILSCVRTDHVGFIDSDKRTNVALTRARHHLLIVGHVKILSTNDLWSKIVTYCRGFPDGVQRGASFLDKYSPAVKQPLPLKTV